MFWFFFFLVFQICYSVVFSLALFPKRNLFLPYFCSYLVCFFFPPSCFENFHFTTGFELFDYDVPWCFLCFLCLNFLGLLESKMDLFFKCVFCLPTPLPLLSLGNSIYMDIKWLEVVPQLTDTLTLLSVFVSFWITTIATSSCLLSFLLYLICFFFNLIQWILKTL